MLQVVLYPRLCWLDAKSIPSQSVWKGKVEPLSLSVAPEESGTPHRITTICWTWRKENRSPTQNIVSTRCLSCISSVWMQPYLILLFFKEEVPGNPGPLQWAVGIVTQLGFCMYLKELFSMEQFYFPLYSCTSELCCGYGLYVPWGLLQKLHTNTVLLNNSLEQNRWSLEGMIRCHLSATSHGF